MRKRYGVILAVVWYIVFFFYREGWVADWKPFAINNRATFYFDPETISHLPGNSLRVWVKDVLLQEGIIDVVRNYGQEFKDVEFIKSLYEYNCTENKMRVLSVTYYSKTGLVITTSDRQTEWQFNPPESIGDLLSKKVCQ